LPLEKEKIDEIIDELHSHLKRQEVTVRQMKVRLSTRVP
jgi:hypothetical protein